MDAAPSDNDNSEEEEFVPYRNVHAAPSDDPSELDQYDYELPERLIAQTPLPDRTAARMMVVDRATQTISHMHVR
ncbi:MAG: S-adenosylmethionine:tRNA ribosyltransferase-isomerase, partial [Thermoguttaceae bacterium]|nr:S-adenosylmethionine:tRNA ribosyltransferase-isomerase [Thermoguttaceae bacterium]